MGTNLSAQFSNILEEFGQSDGIEDAFSQVTEGQPVV